MPLRTMQSLPPIGPVWYGFVMSTGAAPYLLLRFLGGFDGTVGPGDAPPAAEMVAAALWFAAAVGCFLLTAVFGYRSAHDLPAFRATWGEASQVLPWGAVAIGFLSLSSSTPLLLPALWPESRPLAMALTWPAWVLGTFVGAVCAVVFLHRAWHRRAGTPSLGWGLAAMPTLVGSTCTAELGWLYPGSGLAAVLGVIAAVQFAAGTAGAIAVFALGYWWVLRHDALEPAVMPTVFMPIGLAGQSAASTQHQAANIAGFDAPAFAEFVRSAAIWHSAVALPIGVACLGFALYVLGGGLWRHVPFTPAWLSMAYPLGSFSLGLAGLAELTDIRWLWHSGAVAAVVFGGLWLLGTVVAVLALHKFREQWLGRFRVANLGQYARQRWDALRAPARQVSTQADARGIERVQIRERAIGLDDDPPAGTDSAEQT